MDEASKHPIFEAYFRIFPWERLPANAVSADVGCGSGRWATVVTSRVGGLYLVDASALALGAAEWNLAGAANCTFVHATANDLPIEDASLDFAFSLGVLHHVPDTAAAIRAIAAKLKPGAPFPAYLYYAFENRPRWFRVLWRASDVARGVISRLPYGLRYGLSQGIAIFVYFPLARAARALDRRDKLPDSWPLGYYRDNPLYVMRTDALDRFGTRLERRFTRREIETMLRGAGFHDVTFSERPPYRCALGFKT